MSTHQLHVFAVIDFAGDIPADERTRMLQAIDDGKLDLALLNLLRDELLPRGADWRFTTAATAAAILESGEVTA